MTLASQSVTSLTPPRIVVGHAELLKHDYEAVRAALENSRVPVAWLEQDVATLFRTRRDLPSDDFLRLYDAVPDRFRSAALATAAGKISLLEALRSRGVDFNIVRFRGESLVTIAAAAERRDVVEWAIARGIRPLPLSEEPNELAAATVSFLPAARYGEGALPLSLEGSVFEWLVARGYQPSIHPKARDRLLGNLASIGDLPRFKQFVQFYKQRGLFDPNASLDGAGPLIQFAHTVPVLDYLRQEGADLRARIGPRGGYTDLFQIRRNNQEVQRFLVANGLKPQISTLLERIRDHPAETGSVLELLRVIGLNDLVDADGSTLLHVLVRPHVPRITQCRHPSPTNPILIDCEILRRVALIKELLAAGADAHRKDNAGRTPMNVAVEDSTHPGGDLYEQALRSRSP